MTNIDHDVKVVFGMGQLQNIVFEIEQLAVKNERTILLLSGKSGLLKSGYKEELFNYLKEYNLIVFDQVNSYPDVSDLFELKKSLEGIPISLIIPVGGGSVIDIAKGLAAFYSISLKSVENLVQAIGNFKVDSEAIVPPILAIPTVAGSGSEITCWATFWDKKAKRKYSIEANSLYPKTALIDPLLSLSLPQKQTAISALDALCHATEAYWAKKSNKVVRQHSLKAIQLIKSSLIPLLLDLQNIELRSKLFEAAVYSALAFSQTKTTACHAISYPLTNYFKIDHGIAVCLTLPEILEHNKNAITEIELLYDAFGIDSSVQLKLFLNSILEMVGTGKFLRDYGVDLDSLPFIADQAFNTVRMANNPVTINKDEVYHILHSIF